MTLFKGSCHVKLIIDSLSLSILFSPYSNSFPLNSRLGAAKSSERGKKLCFWYCVFFWCASHPETLHIETRSKQEKVPFGGRERCVFVFLCSKKRACGHPLTDWRTRFFTPCSLILFFSWARGALPAGANLLGWPNWGVDGQLNKIGELKVEMIPTVNTLSKITAAWYLLHYLCT